MANDKSFKIKNGLSVGTRYESKAGADGAGADGPSDAFSTTLYSGNNGTQTITNNINLSTDGGLVWVKQRTASSAQHALYDTERGTLKGLASSNTSESATETSVTSFNSDGFTLGTHNNTSGETYVSWTFKETADFFDIVTYTGIRAADTSIAHNLGSVPGMIIVKRTDGSSDWFVYHVGVDSTAPEDYFLKLNDTGSRNSDTNIWNSQAPSSTHFYIGDSNDSNGNGDAFIAYLFAHDTSDDGYIQCGSYTGNGSTSGPTVTLGWKPQFLMIKNAGATGDWIVHDVKRGMAAGIDDLYLKWNSSLAEAGGAERVSPTSTGFQIVTNGSFWNSSGVSYIYMAIRDIAYNYDMDLSTGTYFSMTPSGDTTFTISNPPASGKAIGFALEVNGDGSTLTWPSSIKWHEGTTPTATATKELYTFITTDGGTTYYGKKAGENLA